MVDGSVRFMHYIDYIHPDSTDHRGTLGRLEISGPASFILPFSCLSFFLIYLLRDPYAC